jgi:hypothetical protein
MLAPPDPQNARSPAARQSDRAKSQSSKSTSTVADDLTDLKALKIARRYFLAHTTARTIAALAFVAGPR